MRENPNTVAIGAFVVGAILIAIATLIFLLGSGFGKKETVVMVFSGSVKGLNVGAPLALRGVQVGKVTKIELQLNSDQDNIIMMVEAVFDEKNIRRKGSQDVELSEELISRGLRAQLNSQSLLTGLLYVELDFHPNSPLHLVDINSPYIQLPTIPTSLERITKKLQDIDISKVAGQLESIGDGIDQFVTSKSFQGLPDNVTSTMDSLRELSSQLQEQLATTGPKLDTVLDEAAETVATANTELPKLATLVEENLRTLNNAISAVEQSMTNIDELVSPDSETLYRLNNALQEMTRAGRALQSLASTLEEQPEALIRGKRGNIK
ncbi:MAG: MlaD family protein [Halioglobus sp.]|jgi:paraquat-inducible protein B|nr:MlaD family protein [Halioglobus sp.]